LTIESKYAQRFIEHARPPSTMQMALGVAWPL
jgi:hypothetical protein